jgi:uncharacterized protein
MKAKAFQEAGMKIIKWKLQGIAAIIIGFVLYLLFIGLIPGITVPPQPLKRTRPSSAVPDGEPTGPHEDVQFDVGGVALSAWFYLPAVHSGPVPCVVMAHGLGGTRDMGLDFYARHFQAHGYAVLVFDYRHFGASAGEPRQLVWIPHQLADWAGAIAYARSRPEVDAARIALWGTSLSGGHVIVTAAKDDRIACVVAQCPGVDGTAAAEQAFRRDIRHSLALVMHGQRDLVRGWLNLAPHKVPIVGEPGTVALMTAGDAYAAFADLAPATFVNEACARIAVRGDKYRPITYADKVHCPVLLQICDDDAFTPRAAAVAAAQRLGAKATEIHYPIGHFDIYFGDNRVRSVGDQLAFLQQHLG